MIYRSVFARRDNKQQRVRLINKGMAWNAMFLWIGFFESRFQYSMRFGGVTPSSGQIVFMNTMEQALKTSNCSCLP